VALTDEGSVGAEKFRALAIRLRNFQRRQKLRKILVTSSVKGEGKSVISANLAVTLAQGQRTLLLDCDLHQSGLRDVLGSHGQPGLADWWRQSDPIGTFLRRLDGLSLWYLSAGQVAEPPMAILRSRRFGEMLSQIARWFDWIIIDSPPLVPVSDSSLLAAHADGTLLVVRQAQTPKPLLSEALKTENLKLLGVVANEWESLEHRYYSQYYRGYTPHPEPTPADSRHLPNLLK
jgi:capsular exopolysaccharide synthesis family protein